MLNFCNCHRCIKSSTSGFVKLVCFCFLSLILITIILFNFPVSFDWFHPCLDVYPPAYLNLSLPLCLCQSDCILVSNVNSILLVFSECPSFFLLFYSLSRVFVPLSDSWKLCLTIACFLTNLQLCDFCAVVLLAWYPVYRTSFVLNSVIY